MTDIKFPTETRKVATSLIDRTLRNLRDAWRDISTTARGAIGAAGSVAPALPDSDLDELRRQINDCLEARGGEVSARARAAALGRLYLGLNAEGRKRFLKLIAAVFDGDHRAVQAAPAALARPADPPPRAAARRPPAAARETQSAYDPLTGGGRGSPLTPPLYSARRCFAFFHPRMPSEPLIFVEVALVTGMAGNIQALLDEKAPVGDPRNADTAIFYSISNAQKGLAGVSFGGLLIKRDSHHPATQFPRLRSTSAPSPPPG